MKLFIFILCFLPTSIYTQSLPIDAEKPILVYSDATQNIETSRYAAVLEDAKKELSIEQIRAMPDTCFHWAKPGRLNLGNTSSRFWVRFYIDNRTKEDLYFFCMV